MTELPTIIILPSTSVDKCGQVKNHRGISKIYIPLSMTVFDIKTRNDKFLYMPKKMGRVWFYNVHLAIRKHIERIDWDSFRNNILMPNKEHIRIACNTSIAAVNDIIDSGKLFFKNYSNTIFNFWKESFETAILGRYPRMVSLIGDLNDYDSGSEYTINPEENYESDESYEETNIQEPLSDRESDDELDREAYNDRTATVLYTLRAHRIVNVGISQHLKTEIEEMAIALKKTFDCPICLEVIPFGQLDIAGCGHKYCKTCLAELKKEVDAKCAMCRLEIAGKND